MLAVCYEYMLKITLRSVGRIVKNFFITNWIGLYFGRLLIRVPRAKKIAENWRTEEIFRTEGLKAGRSCRRQIRLSIEAYSPQAEPEFITDIEKILPVNESK